jgi:hypothetical protein
VEFRFALTGVGWAEGRLSDGSQHVRLTASYLTDALGDLLAAVESLLSGAPHAAATWEAEPAQFRWLVDRAGGGVGRDVHVRVVPARSTAYRDGEPIFETVCSLEDLARAVASEADAVLGALGEDGYRARWRRPFPLDRLRAVQGHLAAVVV